MQLHSWRDAIAAAPAIGSLMAAELHWGDRVPERSGAQLRRKNQSFPGLRGIVPQSIRNARELLPAETQAPVPPRTDRPENQKAFSGGVPWQTTLAQSIKAQPAVDSSSSTARAAPSRSPRKEHAQIYPQPGWVEHNAEENLAAYPRSDIRSDDEREISSPRPCRDRHHQSARNHRRLESQIRQAPRKRSRLARHPRRRLRHGVGKIRRSRPFSRQDRPAPHHIISVASRFAGFSKM